MSRELDIVNGSLCNLCALALWLALHMVTTQCWWIPTRTKELSTVAIQLDRFLSCLVSQNIFQVVSALQFIVYKSQFAIWSRDTGQRIPCFDRCQLIKTSMSNIKDTRCKPPCIRLVRGKFELTNPNSAGGNNFTVGTSPDVNVSYKKGIEFRQLFSLEMALAFHKIIPKTISDCKKWKIWNIIFCESNLSHSSNWVITVINASAAVTLLEQRPEKNFRLWAGFEPTTSAMPVQCSPNWAIKATWERLYMG